MGQVKQHEACRLKSAYYPLRMDIRNEHQQAPTLSFPRRRESIRRRFVYPNRYRARDTVVLCDSMMMSFDKMDILHYKMLGLFDKTGVLCDNTSRLFDKMSVLCDNTSRLFDKMGVLYDKMPRLFDKMGVLYDKMPRLFDKMTILSNKTLI